MITKGGNGVEGARGDKSRDIGELVVGVLERFQITDAIGVPDSQLHDVLDAAAPRLRLEFVAREDVAVAMAVGMGMSGGRCAVFMKNAGLGTSLDALVSLCVAASVPIVLVVGWAGAGNDRLPHHVVMGERTPGLLENAGIGYDIVRRGADNDSDSFLAHLDASWRSGRTHALLVEP